MHKVTVVCRFYAAVLVLLLAIAGMAAAMPGRDAPVVGNDFRVSGPNATKFEVDPAAAYNPAAGEYLAVWSDWRDDPTGSPNIYGRRLHSDGVPASPDYRISGLKGTGEERHPAVVFNAGDSQYLVVWADERDASRGSDIWGRLLASNGKPAGPDFRISGDGATKDEMSPEVAFNSATHEYLVVWLDMRNAERASEIFGRRLDRFGDPIGGDFRISGLPARYAMAPAVAADPGSKQYFVVWADKRNDASRGNDVFGRLVGTDTAGAVLGKEMRICGNGARKADTSPAVAFDPDAGEYLVVWQDERKETTRGADIYGRVVAADGTPAPSDFRISASRDQEYNPAVSFAPSTGRFLVAWQDQRRSATRGSDIYGRRLDGGATVEDQDFRICGNAATKNDLMVSLAYDETHGRHLALWADGRRMTITQQDIFGRLVEG